MKKILFIFIILACATVGCGKQNAENKSGTFEPFVSKFASNFIEEEFEVVSEANLEKLKALSGRYLFDKNLHINFDDVLTSIDAEGFSDQEGKEVWLKGHAFKNKLISDIKGINKKRELPMFNVSFTAENKRIQSNLEIKHQFLTYDFKGIKQGKAYFQASVVAPAGHAGNSVDSLQLKNDITLWRNHRFIVIDVEKTNSDSISFKHISQVLYGIEGSPRQRIYVNIEIPGELSVIKKTTHVKSTVALKLSEVVGQFEMDTQQEGRVEVSIDASLNLDKEKKTRFIEETTQTYFEMITKGSSQKEKPKLEIIFDKAAVEVADKSILSVVFNKRTYTLSSQAQITHNDSQINQYMFESTDGKLFSCSFDLANQPAKDRIQVIFKDMFIFRTSSAIVTYPVFFVRVK